MNPCWVSHSLFFISLYFRHSILSNSWISLLDWLFSAPGGDLEEKLREWSWALILNSSNKERNIIRIGRISAFNHCCYHHHFYILFCISDHKRRCQQPLNIKDASYSDFIFNLTFYIFTVEGFNISIWRSHPSSLTPQSAELFEFILI